MLAAFIGVGVAYKARATGPHKAEQTASMEALFSPGGNICDRIVDEINEARDSIRIQVHFFTSKPISDALVAAKKRGTKVEVILDKSQKTLTYGRWKVLRRDGVKVWFDHEHEIANSKILLIDDHTIITGSYNFTKAAEEKNAETVVIIKNNAELFEKFAASFETHREHAKKAGD